MTRNETLGVVKVKEHRRKGRCDVPSACRSAAAGRCPIQKHVEQPEKVGQWAQGNGPRRRSLWHLWIYKLDLHKTCTAAIFSPLK